jgi:hypothetical protein
MKSIFLLKWFFYDNPLNNYFFSIKIYLITTNYLYSFGYKKKSIDKKMTDNSFNRNVLYLGITKYMRLLKKIHSALSISEIVPKFDLLNKN